MYMYTSTVHVAEVLKLPNEHTCFAVDTYLYIGTVYHAMCTQTVYPVELCFSFSTLLLSLDA